MAFNRKRKPASTSSYGSQSSYDNTAAQTATNIAIYSSASYDTSSSACDTSSSSSFDCSSF